MVPPDRLLISPVADYSLKWRFDRQPEKIERLKGFLPPTPGPAA